MGGVRWFLATLVAVFAALCFTALPSYAADTQMEPAHSKTLKDNGDGTSTLSLSVTGDSTLSTTSSKADVIVVLDRSGSMSWGTGSGYRSRLQVAKSAINSLADTLLANNTASDPDKIRLSLVTFANYATTDITNTASLSSFQNTVRSIRADGGTNWEDALAAANSIQTRDGAKKYVIFVSDGDPTFRNTQGNRQFWQSRADYEGHTSGGHTYYGTGDSDDYSNNYNYALQVAQTIAGGGSELYSVAAFGDVSDMQSFSESATGRTDRYYSADDQDALNNAFSAIVQSITNSFGYKSVKITDGVTDATSSTVLQSGSIASDFTYTITDPDGKATTIALDSDGNIKTINDKTSDVTLTDSTGASYILGIGDPFPAASASDKTITWDLSALGQLLDGYEYKVSFKVWPSQDAYDTVAALLNGTKSWDDVDHAQYTRTENSDGSYSYALKTNTQAKVDYTAVKTIDDSHGGTTTEETSGSAAYDQPDPIKLVSDSMGVSKKWVGDTALADDASVTLELYIDGQPSGKTVTLNADNKWKANVHIAPGLEADGQTLNAGHDYTLSEQSTTDSRFEYSAETAHPMIVDGKLAVSDTDGDSALTATNILKSSLNITKTVKDASHDGSADADTLFTYTIAVSDAAHGEVWFSIGKDGKTQIFDADQIAQRVSGAQAEQDSDGKYTGYFHAASGTQVTVKVKDGENIYFPTLTTGSTYTVTEETPAVGYENTNIVNDGGSATNAVPTATGTIEKNNSAYTVGYTNTFDSVSLSGSDALKVTKNVTGRNATEQFAFALTPDADTQAAIDNGSIKVADGANQASTSTKGYIAKDGFETVSFGKYTFYKEGTYHFTADETTETSAPGWTYDSSTHDITVTVAKGADGSLTASTEGNNPVFTNSYAAAPVAAKIPVTKRLDVSDGLTAPDISGKYTFTLKAATEGAPMPEKTSLANPDADGGTVEFGDITYTKPGTYEYTVAESGSVAGVANDPVPERTVQVVVADDGRGQLTAAVNGGSEIGFTNTYTVGEAKARIDVVKSLRSSDGLVPPDISGKYTFTLAAVTEGAPMPEKTSLSNPDAAGGSMAFGDIAYDKPGTYEYTVTESGSVDGVTNDPDATKSVTVVVKDNSDGTMSATVNGGKQVVFENTYKASPATASISAKKVLAVASGDNAPDIAGKYTFELQAIDNAPLPEKTRATNPDSTGGTVEFGDITYTKPGTYRYTVTESGSVAGVANDANATRNVEVVVSDNHAGKLKVDSVTSVKDLTFNNTYTAKPVSVDGSALVKKTVTKADETGNGKTFTFDIDGASKNTQGYSARGSVSFDAGETGTKDISFDGFTFTEPGTYRYTVTEDDPGNGWTVSGSPAEVTINVADNGKGALVAKVTGATISNSYKGSTTITTDAEGSAFLMKNVSAASSTKGASFEFRLVGTSDNTKDADGNFYSADGVATFAAGETGDKAVDFGKITYTQDGTYTYKVTETSVPDGWTASPAEADVTVVVTDNGDGTLSAQVTGATIANSYSVQSATAKIPVTKRLTVPKGQTGPGDITGKYTFKLQAIDNAPLPETTEATNPDSTGGTVEFGDITYTQPGTYHYTVTESGSVDGVTNDEYSSKDVEVVVTDNGDGTLSTKVNNNRSVVFTNSYAAAPVAAKIPVTKRLDVSDGLTAPDISGKYTFTLKAATEGAPMPEKTSLSNPDSTGGTVEFGDITYTQPGTYEYTVTESGSVDGVTNDPVPERTVQVVVADDGRGQLTATVNGGSEIGFTNTYTVGEAKARIDVVKSLRSSDGLVPPDISGKYTFTLKAATEGAPMPEKTSLSNPDAAGGGVAFGDIAYDKPGTYEYTVTESGSVDGVTNDPDATKSVTVVVKDNSDGTMSATVNGGKQVVFENTYKASPATASISAKKVLAVASGDNAPDIAGKYTFELQAIDNAPLPEKTRATNPDSTGGTVEFGDITYTKPGTYRYTVTESGSVAGVANDNQTKKHVTVTVTDNSDGTLSAEVTQGKDLTFTNTYKVASITASIPVTKKLSVPEGLTGPGSIAGKYTFNLEAVDGAPLPAATSLTNPDRDGGTVEFGKITYTQPGTYKYTVTESGSVDGVTNDEQATKNVAVVVADNGDGTLTATVNGGKDITFTNAYKASPATATISAKKVLAVASGDNAPDIAGKYTFELQAIDNAPLPETTQVTNPDADGGTAEFGKIEFTKAGTYHYTVTESGSVKGIDNDAHATKDVVVVVTDNHAGALSAKVTQGKDLTFTNTYKVASTTASIPVTKKLSVAEGLTGPGSIAGKYTFTLEAEGDAPMPETTRVTNPDADGGTAEFGSITYAEPGTYRYTVTESGSVAGVTNDAQATKDVTVIVTDNGDGTLTAQVNNGRDLTFTNTYTPESATLDGDATLKATKVLTGAELTEGAFNFKAEVETENGTKMLTTTNAKDGSVTFDASGLKYTKPGEYKATISEVIPDNAKGITYDTSTHDVLITVKDNGAGKLVASLDGNNPTFKNVYTAKGAANITFSKKVNGKAATTNMFHFTIMADNGGALPENTTVENNGGSVSFGPIAYDESIFGEDDADDSSSSSSSAADKSSSSSATDDGTAAKESTDTGHAADSTATTSSTTESAATASESASSTESSASTSNENADGVEKAYAAEAKPAVQKDANGNRYIDYSYTITEANEGASGYTYDDAAMHVMIHVTDKGDGNLEAKVIYQDKTSFENTYSATGSATITAKKDVEGTDLRDGQFTFGLYDGKDKVAEASNDASGNVTFTVDYDQTMIGTHVYTLKEISDGQTGYTYDGSAKTVAVEVADNGDGELKCTTETGDELTFTNRYQPIATDIALHATKKYEDKSGKAKKLTAGEFKFQVADESGKVMGTASNKADGSVTFPSIPFTEAGTYTYTISEVAGSDTNHVTYDSATYQVTVTVTDDNGQLKAEATDDNPTFTNTYTPDAPPTPKPDDNTPMKTFVKKVTEMPETGDYTPLLPIALALAGSGAVIAYGMKRRRAEAKVNGASHRR